MSSQALSTATIFQPHQVLSSLQSGQKLKVVATKGNLLIICLPYHAEIVGSGAAVGGLMDLSCRRIIPVGKVALTYPQSHLARQKAYLIRSKWIETIQNLISRLAPLQRAYTLLSMLQRYCGMEAVNELPDQVLAQLIGVLPKTVTTARQLFQHQYDCQEKRLILQ